MYEAKDKVFLITGGAAGIGEGIVRAFIKEGAKHIAVLDLNESAGRALESDLAAKYGADKINFYKCDVTTSELYSAFDGVVDRFGYIDVVINCAGLLNDSPKVYEKSIAVNVTALINSSLRAYELMRKDRSGKGGTIINISSIVALSQSPFLPVYNATKSAVLHFSNSLGMEPTYSRTNVRMVTVCFGCTDTSLFDKNKAGVFDSEEWEPFMAALRASPMQRPESAVSGLVEAFKNGSSASTWLVIADQPARDITSYITEAYNIMNSSYKKPKN